ncbi:MAG: CinA family protein [Candidatus Poseidoniales archaeon]|nr:CinA family protein [Candidatus Poseidoniales archaeon]
MTEEASIHAAKLARRLKQERMWLATAESCTGGLLTSILTDISGASNWFKRGWITYSDESKKDELGVDEDLFVPEEGSAGAVSKEVAEAMAIGAAKRAGTDMAISITGIAGPTGETEGKEVGLVWVGVQLQDRLEARSAEFGHGDRYRNKEAFANFALRTALQIWDDHFSEEEPEAESDEEEAPQNEVDGENDSQQLDSALKTVSGGNILDNVVDWDGEPETVEEPSTSIPGADVDWDE